MRVEIKQLQVALEVSGADLQAFDPEYSSETHLVRYILSREVPFLDKQTHMLYSLQAWSA